jgi:lysophospholipase L1-like esterase
VKSLKTLTYLAFLSVSIVETQAQTEEAVILMFGDSITYGIGVLPQNFPAADDGKGGTLGPSVEELQRLLSESRRKSLVLNWGLGGSNSARGASRLASSIDSSKNLHASSQYFVLIQYGTNDEGTISTDSTKANIESMIKTAQEKLVIPILGNLTERSDQSVNERNIKIADIAQEMGVPLVDHNSTLTPFSTYFVYEPSFLRPNDYIYLHPNQMGYDKLALNWFNSELQNLIQPSAPVITPIISLLLDDN